jgi:twitching motility protein PilJ
MSGTSRRPNPPGSERMSRDVPQRSTTDSPGSRRPPDRGVTPSARPPIAPGAARADADAGAVSVDVADQISPKPARRLPLIGRLPVARQMTVLLVLLVAFALLFLGALALFEWESSVPALRSLVSALPVPLNTTFAALCAAFFLTTLALVKVALDENRFRTAETHAREIAVQRAEADARRIGARTEEAVLRLMGELQKVAEGDLTVRATVSDDITGAIAGTVNHTLDELRYLVGRINQAVAQVTEASGLAAEITTTLLSASEQQSREIKSTGQKMLSMATHIQDASHRASESARAARASLDAADDGAGAVQDQIAGMQGIREQIQNTAKRVKRLGESSQEIGEIVELISDISEQTHVLALNAAIQSAAAGEAGRGFAVVAEEVQRLADRSAEAARQIGTLIRTIQADTHDTVAAMERSTLDVIGGTKLSDAAGTSLAEIGRVTRQVTNLIESVAQSTEVQARSAVDVAKSIERILAVTDDTSEGTRQTALSIGRLAGLAQELKASVARFRVG